MNLAMKKFNSSGSPNPRPRLLDVNLWTGFNRTGKRVFVAIMRWNRRKAGCESARHSGLGLPYSRERVTQCCKSVRRVHLSIFIQTFSNNSPVGIGVVQYLQEIGISVVKLMYWSHRHRDIGLQKGDIFLKFEKKKVQKLYFLVLFLITLYISHGFIVPTHVTIQYGRYTPLPQTSPNLMYLKQCFPKQIPHGNLWCR